MSNPPPRYDPQTGRPLNEPPGMKRGAVAAIAVVAAAVGLGAGALAFGGDDNTKTTDSVVTAPGRTEVTVHSTPAQTVTQTETETVTVNTTADDSGGATP